MATVGITASPTTLIEAQNTIVTLTFTLDQPPPTGGLLVSIDSETPRALAEFDVFAAQFSGAQLAGANSDSSGFTLRLTQQTATIQLPIFNDGETEGTDRFTFTLQPNPTYTINPAASAITLTVEDTAPAPANRSPVAVGEQFSAIAGTTLTVPAATGVLLNDSDPDGNPLTAAVVTAPGNGSLTLNADGSFAYTPNAGFLGADAFTYQASDGSLNSAATVSIQVFSPAIVGTPGRDRLTGTAQNDSISGLGGRDRLAGLGGNDEIVGGAGNDILLGGDGNDFLVGDSDDPRIRGGNDRIEGGNGNDTLFGNTGVNVLIGGKGRDLFVLEKQLGHQIIQDFNNRQDRINVNGFSGGELDITQRGRDTIVRGEGDLLAILKNVRADRVTNIFT